MILTGVYRSIVRHASHIDDPRVLKLLPNFKYSIKTKPKVSQRAQRHAITKIYAIEEDLRKVCNAELSIELFLNQWAHNSDKLIEKNQVGSIYLWRQMKERRFDKYNSPPIRGSPEFHSVDRKSKFSVAIGGFYKKHGIARGNKANPAVDTIFVPYWKSIKPHPPETPREVEVRAIKRSAGSLSLLRIRGIRMRSVGFKRHIDAIDTRFHERIEHLQQQIRLATEYQNSFDGENMSDWLQNLHIELQNQRGKYLQLGYKLEVQRRILHRRKLEMEIYWRWKYRQKILNAQRRAQLTPKPLLTLDSL